MSPEHVSALAPDPGVDLSAYFKAILEAASGGKGIVLTGLILIGLVFAIRKYGAKLWAPLGDGKYAVGVVLITGMVLQIGTTLADTGGVGGISGLLAQALTGLVTGVMAGGLYKVAKDGYRMTVTSKPTLKRIR